MMEEEHVPVYVTEGYGWTQTWRVCSNQNITEDIRKRRKESRKLIIDSV